MSKHDLTFEPRMMNAAGSLGFTPDLHAEIDWTGLGAFVTNPVSLARRTPAQGPRTVSFPGGFLLHTGYPNPGFSQVLSRYASRWRGSPIPVIVHLLARSPGEVRRMVRQLETVEGVAGVEVGISHQATAEEATSLAQAASGELGVIVRLPMERAAELAGEALKAGADAISLAPPRGAYPMPGGAVLEGRLYGPAVLPLALRTVQELTRAGIPTLGSGGVYTHQQAQAMLASGALAVQLDSVLWCGAGYRLFK